MEVIAECSACRGTGIYRGMAEPPGIGVVCLKCNGEGFVKLEYKPFTGRRMKTDVHTICRSRGSFIATGVGPGRSSVTYEEFLKGKRPGNE